MSYDPVRERDRTKRRAAERHLTAEEAAARTLFRSARKRAALKELPFGLTEDDVREMLRHCNGCCELTGIAFDYGRYRGPAGRRRRRAWFPSIDRVSALYGYLPGNVRIVCVAVNLAMNEWGEDVLRRIGEAIARRPKSAVRWRRGRAMGRIRLNSGKLPPTLEVVVAAN